MNEVTVIIPTIQKNKEVLNKLISTLNEDDIVSEIILIDNSLKGFDENYSKLEIVTPKENLFVNPSWNLGVSMTKTKYFALFNDDLLVCKDFCSLVVNELKKVTGFGICGMAEESVINTSEISEPKQTNITLSEIKENRPNNWGTVIFGETAKYFQIPKQIKILCGDDYYIYKSKKSNLKAYKIENCCVYHLGSLSSGESKFKNLLYKDIMNYGKIEKEFKHYSKDYKYVQSILKKQFFQNLFSVKNDQSHKIMSILGIKIKFKSKKNIYNNRFQKLGNQNSHILNTIDKYLRIPSSLKDYNKSKQDNYNIHIPNNFKEIGRYSYSSPDLFVTIPEKSTLGAFCSIGYNVTIGSGNHPTEFLSTSPYFFLDELNFKNETAPTHNEYKTFNLEGVQIGNDVWIGDNVSIKNGVKIGDGAVIGMGAVVAKDVPPYAIVGGVPAKIIKYRFDEEIIKTLLNLKWWNLDDEIIKQIPYDNINSAIEFLKTVCNK